MTAGRGRPPGSRRCPAAPAGTCPCAPACPPSASRTPRWPRSPPRSYNLGVPRGTGVCPRGPADTRAPAPAARPFLAGRPSRPQAVTRPSRHRQLGAASLGDVRPPSVKALRVSSRLQRPKPWQRFAGVRGSVSRALGAGSSTVGAARLGRSDPAHEPRQTPWFCAPGGCRENRICSRSARAPVKCPVPPSAMSEPALT